MLLSHLLGVACLAASLGLDGGKPQWLIPEDVPTPSSKDGSLQLPRARG